MPQQFSGYYCEELKQNFIHYEIPCSVCGSRVVIFKDDYDKREPSQKQFCGKDTKTCGKK